MGNTKRCYFCGESYYKDDLECPHCSSENRVEMARQDRGRVRSGRKNQKSPDARRPVETKIPPDNIGTGAEGENLDLFAGRRR